MALDPVREALAALSGQRYSIADALDAVPPSPGLYAVYGDANALEHLGSLAGDDSVPLYVGKAERSLSSRDVRTHFSTGKTGSSTLRRSCAALLVTELDLQAVPRNLDKPDGSANFGLEAEGDQRLTDWMHRHLTLAIWVKPGGVVLNDVETAVITEWQPPLNLDKVIRGTRKALKQARARMADQGRTWTG